MAAAGLAIVMDAPSPPALDAALPAPVRLSAAEPAGARDLSHFVTRLREGTLRFHDPAAAAAEGYRPHGPDFPGMGQHWIHAGRVIAGDVDPSRPPVLTYATLDGRVTMVGTAFTHFLDPADDPPAVFGGAASWRSHQVDEEGLFLTHQPSERADAPWLQRVAVVHAWLVDNPSGMTAQNNWRLPYLRVGIEAPADAPVAAARALSLLGGESYYARLFDFAGWLDARERRAVATALERQAACVHAWLLSSQGGGAFDLDALVPIWGSLWRSLEAELAPEAWQRLSPLEES